MTEDIPEESIVEEEEPRVRLGLLKTSKELFTVLHVPKMRYIVPFLLSLIRSIIGLTIPYYFKVLIDIITNQGEFQAFLNILYVLVVLTCFSVIANILTQRAFQRLGISTIYDLRNQIFAHLQTLSLNYYHKQKQGKVMAYLTNDANSVNNLLSSAFIDLVLASIQLVGSLALMIYLSWQMTLIVFVMMPILFFVI